MLPAESVFTDTSIQTEIDSEDSRIMHALSAAALAGGRVVRDRFLNGGFDVEEKTSESDLVTTVDRSVERVIRDILAATVPDATIIGEEASGDDNSSIVDRGAGVVYVDPVDGTMNFVHGFPELAVSIGYWKDDAPYAGVVLNPISNDLYWAMAGMGAYRNGKRIHVSDTTSIETALLASGWPYERYSLPRAIRTVQHLVPLCREVRVIGSAALAVCYVAAGVFDGFWEYSLSPWDLAGAIAIAREAGAVCVSPDGSVFRLHEGNVLVANAGVYSEIVSQLNTVQ